MPLHYRRCVLIGRRMRLTYLGGGRAARRLFGSGRQVAPCQGLTDGINLVIGDTKDLLLTLCKAGCVNHINVGATNELQDEPHEPCGKFIISASKCVV